MERKNQEEASEKELYHKKSRWDPVEQYNPIVGIPDFIPVSLSKENYDVLMRKLFFTNYFTNILTNIF